MDTQQTLKEILKKSALSEYQLSLWSEVIQTLPESSLRNILDFLNQDKDGAAILTDNLVRKEEAFRTGDVEKWGRVLENDAVVVNSK